VLRQSRPGPRPRARAPRRPALEELEPRTLPSVLWPGLANPRPEAEDNDTIGQALDLGQVSLTRAGEAVGGISARPGVAADVDFYQFSLAGPSAVRLTTLDRAAGSPLVSVLSLYDNDPGAPLGHRLIAQDD